MVIARVKKWFRSTKDDSASAARDRPWFLALAPTSLLEPHEGEIAAIKARAGVPADHWRSLYQSVFENYAALVQRLPASESHHHAGPGGLLQHGFEVVRHTLDLKQGIILPRGEAPEVQSRVQDLWTYACVTAALLHDLGKPVTDLHVTLYDAKNSRKCPWTPVQGPMPIGTAYGIEFNAKRVYRHHERIPPLLAHHLIPIEGLEWIADDQAVLHSWLAAIQGDLEDADAIGEIVGKADGLSVARNLSGSTNVQLPTAKAKPLVQRLITGLRYLLDHDALPLNRRGAAAYLDGDTLWLVSKTTLDKLRSHLIKEGQPGIPTRNDRLMDELQQHGLLVANDKDRAVWTCRVTIGDWQQQLTCLRIDAGHIWSDPERRPDPMGGHVEPLGSETTPPVTDENVTNQAANTSNEPASPTAAYSSKATDVPGADDQQTTSSIDDLPLPFDLPADAAGEDEAATGAKPTVQNEPVTAHKADGQVAGMEATEDAGERFLAWLKRSIENQTVPINTAQAPIHVLPEGLALVSPRIFRDFDSANWSHAQKRFQKLKLHRKTSNEENIWTCRIVGNRKNSLLKVMLIPNPIAELSVKLPNSNPRLTLIDHVL